MSTNGTIRMSAPEWTPEVREEWQDDAACAVTDPEIFFPEKGQATARAKRICASCEVRDQCLEYAIRNDERFGIWGGLSVVELRRFRQVDEDVSAVAARMATIARHQREGLSDVRIGKLMGLSTHRVKTLRQSMGLKGGAMKGGRWTADRDAKMRELVAADLSDPQIAAKLGVSSETVRRRRLAAGLPGPRERRAVRGAA